MLTVKGRGDMKLQYCVDASESWHDMTNIMTGLKTITLSSGTWQNLDFNFNGHVNPNPSTVNGGDLWASQEIVDSIVRDAKSIRFRLISDTSVYGFELNDFTIYYRMKGIV